MLLAIPRADWARRQGASSAPPNAEADGHFGRAVIANGAMASSTRQDSRDAVLQLRQRRTARDLFLARAGPSTRRSGALNGGFYEHTAGTMELACVTRGELRIVTPARILRIARRQLLIIERGVHHAELPPLPGKGYLVYWYHLQQTYAHVGFHQRAPDGTLTTVGWELPGRTNVEGLASAAAHELASRNWGYLSAVSGILDYLSCILVRRTLRNAPDGQPAPEAPAFFLDPNESTPIQAALDYCDQHFREGVTQADVAKEIGYSSRYLSRLFSLHLGHSIARHLRDLRLAEAKQLLELSDLPVRSIAARVGYSYPEHFIRAFTREVGLSPGDFRRRLSGT